MFTLARLAIRIGQLYLAVNFGMLAAIVVAKAGWAGVIPAAAVCWVAWKLIEAAERVYERLSTV